MRLGLLISLRVVFGVLLVPVRPLLVVLGGVGIACGGLGTIAWLIQLFASSLGAGGGAGPLSPAVMLVLCAMTVPVGWLLLILASGADPRAQHNVERERSPFGEPVDDGISRQGPGTPWQGITTPAGGQRTICGLLVRSEQVRLRTASREAIGDRRGRRGEH